MKRFITNQITYVPTFGLVLYLIIYSYSATKYPGGSDNFPEATAYSFNHNLLCDTMTVLTPGGTINTAKPSAIVAHLILGFTMITFFLVLPKVLPERNTNTKRLELFGVASMTVFLFMFTDYHNLIVTITGVLGTIAMVFFFIELRPLKNQAFKLLSYLCFTLSIVVFIMFESKFGYYYLPFVQKVAFGLDGLWVVWACNIVKRKNRFSVH